MSFMGSGEQSLDAYPEFVYAPQAPFFEWRQRMRIICPDFLLHRFELAESRTEFSSGISRANCNFLCIEILGQRNGKLT